MNKMKFEIKDRDKGNKNSLTNKIYEFDSLNEFINWICENNVNLYRFQIVPPKNTTTEPEVSSKYDDVYVLYVHSGDDW